MAVTVHNDGESNWKQEALEIRMAFGLQKVNVEKVTTGHAWHRGDQRKIAAGDMERGVCHPKARIVAGEPAKSRMNSQGIPYPHPTRVLATWDRKGDPICIVVALVTSGTYRIVTVYDGRHGADPNAERFLH